jgi:hypothetical protein
MEDQTQEVEESKGGAKSFMGKLILWLLVVALGVGAGIYTVQQKPELFGLSKGQAAVQAETQSLINQVGKLIALPTDETPTIATVTDVSKVKDQPFFKNAVNGDKVLIYTKAQKAILYDPIANKIVEVGAVNINNQPTTPDVVSPSASPSATPKAKK